MKLLVLFAVLSAAYAQSVIVASYSGTTKGSGTWAAPTTSPGETTCTPQATLIPYANFTINVATAGVYQVKCMFEETFRSDSRVLLYTGATLNTVTAAACTGLVAALGNNLGLQGGPINDDGVYMSVGAYTFVVTGTSSSSEGIFACQVKAPTWRGTTVGSEVLVNPVTSVQDVTCSSDSGSSVPSGTFTWTQASSGLFDLSVYFYNASYTTSFGANAAIYTGNSFFNTSVVWDLCASDRLVIAGQFSSAKFAILLQNVSLVGGQNYTAVFAGADNDAIGWWGATIDPTTVATTTNSPGTWTQPSRGDPTSCTSSTYTNSFIYIYTFIAENPTYIFDTQRLDWGDYLDTYSFLYVGLNNGSVPNTCSGLIYDGDTGDVRPLAFQGLVKGNPYTVIVSNYGSTLEGDFSVYAFTGTQLGTIPPPPTTGSPAATTGSPAETTSGDSATTNVGSGAVELTISALILFIAAVITF